MATPIEELPERPSGAIPTRFLRIGIGFLGLVIVLVLMIAVQNSCNAAPAAGQTQVRAGRAESVVSAPPPVPQPRPEPRSVESARPSFGRTDPETTRPSAAMTTEAKAVDPLVAERKKRDFESRYASSVVVSFRPDDGSKRIASQAAAVPGDRRNTLGIPSTDELVDKVMKAYGAANSGGVSLPGAPATSSTLPGVTGTERTSGEIKGGRRGGGSAPTAPDVTPPIDDSGPLHKVLESSIIDAVLVNRLDGSNTSPIVGKVTNPLYSHDGAYVLIPADTKIVGETKAVQTLGESRLVVLFHRLIFPDGSSKSLDQFKGLQVDGSVGLKDQVNHHYLSTFGAAAAISVVTGAGQALGNRSVGNGSGGTTVIAGNAGEGVGQATSQVLNRFLNRLPTITIREGSRFRVYVTSDIELPTYGHE